MSHDNVLMIQLSRGINLKIKANEYKPNEIIKIIREWTGLTQQQFGTMIHRSKHTVQSMELGRSNVYLYTLLDIANQYGLDIIIEKNGNGLIKRG